jgi:hypothetical protein
VTYLVRQALGDAIPISGGASALAIAQMQLAMNRVIRGARQDTGLRQEQIGMARAVTMPKESGFIGDLTPGAYMVTRTIVAIGPSPSDILQQFPLTLTTIDQISTAARLFNAFADGRGYTSPDTVVPAPPTLVSSLPFFGGDRAKEGLLQPKVIAGAAILGVVGFFLWKKAKA